jgi:uncharacterized protein (TIGR03435 family)
MRPKCGAVAQAWIENVLVVAGQRSRQTNCYSFAMPATIARRTRWIRPVLFAIGAAQCGLHAQAVAPPELRFDAASVRPNHTAGCQGRWDFSTSHRTVTAQNAPLLRIVSRAYNLTDDRVSGPAWLDSECYDLTAKAANDATNHELMAMLRELLRDRFHLVAHRELGERPVLALMVDKGGSKLHPYGDKVSMPPSNGRILFMARHLPDLCERIGKVTGRPVIDKTGLDGDYMIVLTYLPFGSLNSDPSDAASDILSAVRDQLGLRLQSQRGAVDVLKIESVDKVPTEN